MSSTWVAALLCVVLYLGVLLRLAVTMTRDDAYMLQLTDSPVSALAHAHGDAHDRKHREDSPSVRD